jgi:hypothetical protein
MVSDLQIMSVIHEAFAAEPRPEHFTNYTHGCECAEHNELLRARDRETLGLEDVGNPGWDPICFVTAEGFRYYLPALVRSLPLAVLIYARGFGTTFQPWFDWL